MRQTSHFQKGIFYKGSLWAQEFRGRYIRVSWDYNDRSNENFYGRFSFNAVMGNNDDRPMFVIDAPADIKFDQSKQIKSAMRRRARYYAENNGHSNGEVFFFETDPTDPWLSHVTRVKWDDIKDIKIPRNPSATPVIKEVPYDFYRYEAATNVATYASEVTSTSKRKTYWISPIDIQETRYKRGTSGPHLMRRFADENIELVVLGANRVEKFKRLHPTAEHLKVYAQEYVNKAAAAISDVHLVVESFEGDEAGFCKYADPSKIDDPA